MSALSIDLSMLSFLCAICASVVFCFGCSTERVESSDGRRLPPTPRAGPAPPSTIHANRMAFMVGSKPDDSNGNGFPDLIRVTVALFATPHPMAVREDGAFMFSLFPQGSYNEEGVDPLGVWRIEGEELKTAQVVAQYGPCYQFSLSMIDIGGDVMPLDRADLVCRFDPADGSDSVFSDGVRTIQIGRRMASADSLRDN